MCSLIFFFNLWEDVYFKSIYSFDHFFFCLFRNIFCPIKGFLLTFFLQFILHDRILFLYLPILLLLYTVQHPYISLIGEFNSFFCYMFLKCEIYSNDLAVCIYVYCDATPTVRDVLKFSDSHICSCLYSFLWFERVRFLNCLDWLYRWRHICVIRIIPDEGQS